MIKNLIYLSCFSFILFSCTPYEDEDDFEPINPSASEAFGIRHDKQLADYENAAIQTGSNLPNFESVVMFSYSTNSTYAPDFVGSGTLIDPQWILTAGHNFFVADEQSQPAVPQAIQVWTGADPNNPEQILEVEKVILHPTWVSENELFDKGNDLCLIKLKAPITNISPSQVNFTIDAEEIGSDVWFAGYGDYTEKVTTSGDYSKRHAIQNVLDRRSSDLGSGDGSYGGGLLAFDFDDPDGKVNSLGDAVINRDEDLLGSGTSSAEAKALEGTTIQGDSGGPIFVNIDGTWKVCGVLSGGADEPIANHVDSSYGDISIFIRTAPQARWIQLVLARE